jgi:hypothetical protein
MPSRVPNFVVNIDHIQKLTNAIPRGHASFKRSARARPNKVGRAQCFAYDAGLRESERDSAGSVLNSVAVCADTHAHARSSETDTAAPLLAVIPAIIIALTGRVSV